MTVNKKYINRNNQLNSARRFINSLSKLGADELFSLVGLEFDENNNYHMQLQKDVKELISEYQIPESKFPKTWRCSICDKVRVDFGKNCSNCEANKEATVDSGKGLGISEISNENNNKHEENL